MSALDEARAALMRALEQIDGAKERLGEEPDDVILVIAYTVVKHEGDGRSREIGGWAATPAPAWVHAALLRYAADFVEESPSLANEEENGEVE
jgi:hypothetical protein